MAIYQLKTFADIYNAVLEEVKIQSSDTTSLNRIKRDINAIYLNEVVPVERWKWLRKYTNIDVRVPYNSGTASVTENDTDVTLSTAIGIDVTGYNFRIAGSTTVYKIANHSANSTAIELETHFSESTNATASFAVWSDSLAMPSDTRDIVEITIPQSNTPMEGKGIQEFRRITATSPGAEGIPRYYTLGDYVDPDPYQAISGLPASSTRASAGLVKTIVFASDVSSLISVGDKIKITGSAVDTYNGRFVVSSVSTTTITYTGSIPAYETSTVDASIVAQKLRNETAVVNYRELLIYPSVMDKRRTLGVDYIIEPQPLENDTDEPLMPMEDRMVLVYGALGRAWSRERNPEESTKNYQLFERKLNKMQGKFDDTTDPVRLTPSKLYLGTKRSNMRFRSPNRGVFSFGATSGGTSSSDLPTNTSNRVAIFNSSGELDASDDISVIEHNWLDDNEPLTAVSLNDNQASAANVLTLDASSYTAVQISYSISRGSANVETGLINLVNDGSSAGLAQGAVASVGTIGVTLTADVSGGSVRLRYTSTSTGTAPTFKYKLQKWQA